MSRRGFTLIEVLIVMAILLLLAGIVYPLFDRVGDQARPTIMATTVRQVREQIIYHAGSMLFGKPSADIGPGRYADFARHTPSGA